jgi:serine/threonine protein kinase
LTNVYKARPANCADERNADYVLKTVRRNLPNTPVAARLLAREAQIGQAVSNPHLAPILSAELDSPLPSVVMPRLAGVRLAATLSAHKRLAAPQALWIARQIGEALAALHGRGWRHADVKPDNILVARSGHATLVDLGFAQPIHERTGDETDHSLLGTFAYLAPELFTNSVRLSAAADVYSLGVSLYEMLTGRLPFLETDPTELAVAHLQQIPPDPRHFAPLHSPRIGWLLRRMLAKEPLRRPETRELISLLAELEVETFEERQTVADVKCG